MEICMGPDKDMGGPNSAVVAMEHELCICTTTNQFLLFWLVKRPTL